MPIDARGDICITSCSSTLSASQQLAETHYQHSIAHPKLQRQTPNGPIGTIFTRNRPIVLRFRHRPCSNFHQRHEQYHRAFSHSRSSSQCQRPDRYEHYHRPSSMSLHLESAIDRPLRHHSGHIRTIISIFLAQTPITGTTITIVLYQTFFP